MLTIIYDLETTGFRGLSLFSRFHRIIQISIHVVELNQSYTSYVHPQMKIPLWSSEIHKITDTDVENAQTIDKVMETIIEKFDLHSQEKVEWISHNNTFFDRIILTKEYPDILHPTFTWWDTLPFFRHHYPGLESYRLGDLYEHFYKRPMPGNAHSADCDVAALTSLYIDHASEDRGTFHYIYNPKTLTQIRFIGNYRAELLRKLLKMEGDTVQEFREKMYTIQNKDDWLREQIFMEDITQRLFVLNVVNENPLWKLKVPLSDPVEYFMAVRFGDHVDLAKSYLYYQGAAKCSQETA